MSDLGLFAWILISVVVMSLIGFVFFKVVKKLKKFSEKLDR